MAKNITAFIRTAGGVTAYTAEKTFVFPESWESFGLVMDALRNDDLVGLKKLADKFAALRTYVNKVSGGAAKGKVEVRDGSVFYMGEELHSCLVDRILSLMKENMPIEGYLKFLENLMENPSKHSVDQLYKFLEHKNLPITDDGHFLAYKSVRDNYHDWHSGKFDNSVGKVHEVRRSTVDDNPDAHCSYGFHAGTIEYASDFNKCDSQRIVLVKINPKDVVSVPNDCNCQKLRTCRYEVVQELTQKEALEQSMYSAQVGSVAPVAGNSDWMDNWGEDDEDADDGDWDDGEDDWDDEEWEDSIS